MNKIKSKIVWFLLAIGFLGVAYGQVIPISALTIEQQSIVKEFKQAIRDNEYAEQDGGEINPNIPIIEDYIDMTKSEKKQALTDYAQNVRLVELEALKVSHQNKINRIDAEIIKVKKALKDW